MVTRIKPRRSRNCSSRSKSCSQCLMTSKGHVMMVAMLYLDLKEDVLTSLKSLMSLKWHLSSLKERRNLLKMNVTRTTIEFMSWHDSYKGCKIQRERLKMTSMPYRRKLKSLKTKLELLKIEQIRHWLRLRECRLN